MSFFRGMARSDSISLYQSIARIEGREARLRALVALFGNPAEFVAFAVN